ncbi:uncharacterized protein B0J16DRAFT_394251 [Fusarium flagelliforme]|uniref:Uncharacterized protein n=1 Tax=Fusarium flagelliforme TaxID=2675880 RepID=A0A395N5J3_9HYPO|nr:uncharacterized protein B0J16DRAFT_394251 [Fusarium flagelliforme]KAH7192206.1 hypothetical protein B0J16DRAFT_394251 [Fusarium flagelliforme]RFN55382.1 hypothetical protein FIE12Z_257 [Fusarium flagelliforme]
MADTHQGPSASNNSKRPSAADRLKLIAQPLTSKYLVLTPIEKNHTDKDYIRLSMVFPVGFTCEESSQLSARLASQARELFERTLRHWPFLNGDFGTKVIGGKIRLVLWYTQPVTQGDVRDRFTEDMCWLWPKKVAPECQDISTLPLKLFEFGEITGKHTEPEEIAGYFDNPNYPVMVRVKLLKEGVFVIRFAFSERIFDMQFVQNFLRQFLDFTLPETSFKNIQPLDVRRTMPKIEKRDGLIHIPTEKSRLGYMIYRLKEQYVRNAFGWAVGMTLHDGAIPISFSDCIFAFLWYRITQARWETGGIEHDDMTRAFIKFPGHHSIRAKAYYGNSTYTAAFSLRVDKLIDCILDEEDTGERKTAKQQLELKQKRDARESIRLADAIRRISIASHVDGDVLQKFYGVKQSLSPEEDEEASSRALRTQHDVVFENWIDCGYARGSYIRAFFGGNDVYPYFMPCVDHMEEGKVILLPPWGKGRKISNDMSQ